MKTINKTSVYAKLLDIKENKEVDTSKYVREMVGSDTVPFNVLVFINKHYPIEQLAVYNKIYESRRNNPLYKNLVNENLPIEEMAISLSSFLTHTLIKSKETIKEGREEDGFEYLNITNSEEITNALHEYAKTGETDKLVETFLSIREVFKNLYKKTIK